MNYTKILPFDLANGTGVRVSLFLSGCNFHCPDCFNQESQRFDYGKPFTSNTVDTIFELISNPYVSGLSLRGGDPLCQDESGLKELIVFANAVRQKSKTVWIWSGFTWEEIKSSKDLSIEAKLRQLLVESCNVFVDGRFDKNLKDLTLKWRGSSNQRVIDVQKSLSANKVVLYEDTN